MMKNNWVIVVTSVVLLFGLITLAYLNTQQELIAQVWKTERVQTDGNSYYLVFTDKGVFQNSDSLLFCKFNSSDIYGKLILDKSFSFTIVGWRVPFLSMYPNIIRAQEK